MDLTRLRGEYGQKGFVAVVIVLFLFLSTWTRERDSMVIIVITTTITIVVVVIIINIIINRGTPRIVTFASDFETHILPEYRDSFTFDYFIYLRCKQVLSLKLYKSEQSSSATANKDEDKEKEKSTQESGATASSSAKSAEASGKGEQSEGGQNPLEGLDDITKTCFEVCTLTLFVILELVKLKGCGGTLVDV